MNELPKFVNEIWALVARKSGNECPLLIRSMPDACSLSARRLVNGGTSAGQCAFNNHFHIGMTSIV